MSSQPTATHQIEVYTANAAWRGNLVLPAHRRVLDFLNDALHNFFNLTQVTQLGWEYGFVTEKGACEVVHIHRNTINAVIRTVDPLPAPDALMRIEKVPHRIVVYSPPFTLEGEYHVVKGGDLYESIDSSRQDFFALTNGMILLDKTPLLQNPAELMVINRRYISGFRIIG